MKYIVFLNILISVFFSITVSAYPKVTVDTPVVYIEVDPKPDTTVKRRGAKNSNRAHFYDEAYYELNYLRFRVRLLEQAVNQLQRTIYQLDTKEKTHVVYLKTLLKGTFIGKGSTRAEAIGDALVKCEKGNGGIECSEYNVRTD